MVPAGENWLISNATLYVSVLPAGNTNWKVAFGYVRRTAYSPIFQGFGNESRTFLVGDTINSAYNFHPGDLILRPGDYLVATFTGAGATFTGGNLAFFNFDYVRLEI
jgi:hypothetical protein